MNFFARFWIDRRDSRRDGDAERRAKECQRSASFLAQIGEDLPIARLGRIQLHGPSSGASRGHEIPRQAVAESQSERGIGPRRAGRERRREVLDGGLTVFGA
jgi:hypothetical protein